MGNRASESAHVRSASGYWVIIYIDLRETLRAGGLYSHTAAKLIFVRIFRHTHHIYKHTLLGWTVWCGLCFLAVSLAFLFVVAVPIFSFLIGISAALFASWYTYGIAGFFWLHDAATLGGRKRAVLQQPVMFILSVLTVLAGAFICVGGTYVFIKVPMLIS